MSLTSAISSLKGSWQNYKIAGRNGETREDIKYRINFIQDSLGLEQSFPELAEEEQEPAEYRLREEEEQEWMSGLTIDEVEAKKAEELEARAAIVEEEHQPPTISETEDDWFNIESSSEEEDDVWSTGKDQSTSSEEDDW
jgi:hypothetical protein